MLETIVVVTLITLVIVAPAISIAVWKAKKECIEDKLEHSERIKLRRQ